MLCSSDAIELSNCFLLDAADALLTVYTVVLSQLFARYETQIRTPEL